jgi:hypothetical protein
MIDTKETLKKLHKKFPTLSLDDLFAILDCYTEQYHLSWNGSSSSITATYNNQLNTSY